MTNTNEMIRHNRPVSDGLHPLVYKAMAGFALWFALSAWIFFGVADYIGLALAVVSFFLFITVAVPFAIWQAWRGSQISGARQGSQTFRDWAAGEFETWPNSRPGKAGSTAWKRPLKFYCHSRPSPSALPFSGSCCTSTSRSPANRGRTA
jgi:hypothetical protein